MVNEELILRQLADKLAPSGNTATEQERDAILAEGLRKGKLRRIQNRQRLLSSWRAALEKEVEPGEDPLAVAVLVAAVELTSALDRLAEATFYAGTGDE